MINGWVWMVEGMDERMEWMDEWFDETGPDNSTDTKFEGDSYVDEQLQLVEE